MRRFLLLSLLLSLAFVSPLLPQPAGAQAPAGIYAFDLQGPRDVIVLDAAIGIITGSARLIDQTRDSPGTIVPGGPGVAVTQHHTVFTVEVISPESHGWFLQGHTQFVDTSPGETREGIQVNVLVTAQATNPYLRLRMTGTMYDGLTNEEAANRSVEFVFRARGLLGVEVIRQPMKMDLAPRDIGRSEFQVSNNGIYPVQVGVRETTNPCKLGVGTPGAVVLAPKGTPDAIKTMTINVQAPSDQFWYYGESCNVQLEVYGLDGSTGTRGITQLVKVDGFYIDPQWVFNLTIILLILFGIIAFVRRRKERIEERLLGKPEKPWLIPVEQVFLRELKARDPRAWYVVRHYLMEEEYRSALAWFKSYKAATKGDRKKERVILKQEDKYEKWKAKWAKAIAKPMKRADAYEIGLQKTLDKDARKGIKKQSRKHRKAVSKIKAAQSRLHTRAIEKWEKEAAKASKKGRPVPPQPVTTAPALPPEPTGTAPRLADHRWAKKATRFRKRMVKRQGNLEVKFEKADARYLRKIRRKVTKIGRKIDDPAFVNEHPLLREAGTAPKKA